MNIPRYTLEVELGGGIDEFEEPGGAWCKWEDVEQALKDRHVAQVAHDFVRYYVEGTTGCRNCGGFPHATDCFVGRFVLALALDSIERPAVSGGKPSEAVIGRDRCVCGSEREAHEYLQSGTARIVQCADCHRIKTIVQDMGHSEPVASAADLRVIFPDKAK